VTKGLACRVDENSQGPDRNLRPCEDCNKSKSSSQENLFTRDAPATQPPESQ
jgi:hypothetical protein